MNNQQKLLFFKLNNSHELLIPLTPVMTFNIVVFAVSLAKKTLVLIFQNKTSPWKNMQDSLFFYISRPVLFKNPPLKSIWN